MAKLLLDTDIIVADPTKRTLHTDGASVDVFPIGTLVMKNASNGMIQHLSASTADSTCVGVVLQHQDIATAGDNLDYQSGYFFLNVAAGAQPNQVLYALDSGTTPLHIASGSAGSIPVGRYRGATEVDGLGMVEVGIEPAV